MAKKNRSEYSRLREQFRKRIRRLEKKGYFFPEGYMPPATRKPTQADIDFLKSQTLDEIYKQAKWGKWFGDEAIEGTVKREERRQEGKARALINLAKINTQRKLDKKAKEGSKLEYNKELGKEIFKYYFDLLDKKDSSSFSLQEIIPQQARPYFENQIWIYNSEKQQEEFRKLSQMTDEERDKYIEEKNKEYDSAYSKDRILHETLHEADEKRRKERQEIYDYEDEDEDENEDSSYYIGEAEDYSRITDESIEKSKKDPRFEEWMREYKEERKKKPKERQYAYEPEAIYAGILDRIAQFEKLMDSDARFSATHGGNHQYALRLQGILNMQIKLEGFENVMRRLADKGQKIEELLQRMLFQESKDSKINPNFQELVEIIKGEKLSVKEAEMVEQYAIEHSYNPETYEEDIDL